MAITSLNRWDGGDPEKLKTLARLAAPHLLKAGAESVRMSRIFTGPHLGQWMTAVRWRDWEAYGNGTAAISANAEYAGIMAEVNSISRRVDHTLLLGVDL